MDSSLQNIRKDPASDRFGGMMGGTGQFADG